MNDKIYYILFFGPYDLVFMSGFFLNKIAKTHQVKNSRISKLKPKTQAKFPKTQRTGTFA